MRWKELDRKIERYAAEVNGDLLAAVIKAQGEAAKASKRARELFERLAKRSSED